MPVGYKLEPNLQMKIEDERAGRLDYVYETALDVNECLERVGNQVSGRLPAYESQIRDGRMVLSFMDSAEGTGGLFSPPAQEYALRFESRGKKTIIRVRYVWDKDKMNVPYYLREDVDAFFSALFDASPLDWDGRVWTDSAEKSVQSDPLKIHGSKVFWIISAVFAVLWIGAFFLGSLKGWF